MSERLQVTRRWRKIIPIYQFFAQGHCSGYDFSEKSVLECFLVESEGIEAKNLNNGFLLGKKWMDVTIAMWREDIKKGLLFKRELYADDFFKNFEWYLDRVLDGLPGIKRYED